MRLNQTIANHFSAAELTDLAAELGVAGTVRDDAPPEARAADLLAALAATGHVAALPAALAARRPDVAWAALPWPSAALAALHDALDRRLDRDSLRDLCLRLGVDHDNLPGDSKRARVRELLLALERTGRTAELSDEWRVAGGRRPIASDSRLVFRFVNRRLVLVVIALCLLGALLFWRGGRGWAAGPALPDGVIGVAVAEFAETAGCRAGPRGREASALVYETLGRELAAAGLARRVGLTRVGRVCDAASAAAAGRAAGATVVIWGWLPQTTDGLVAAFTPTGPAPAATADLARAFEALFTGPDASLSLRLSGRAVVLSRFLLGLVYAGQGDHAAAEALYSAAIAAVEAEAAAATPEQRRTLAVLLTERGKAQAALGRAAEARADFDAAEAHNPDYLRLLITRAAEAYGRRDWAAAEAYLYRAALQDEPLPTIAYGFGLLEYYRGRYAAAVAQFDRAIALSAADGSPAAVYYLARGYSYVELGDCAAATADFRAARDEASSVAAVREAAGEVACGEVAAESAGGQGGGGVGVGGRPVADGQATAGAAEPSPQPSPEGRGGQAEPSPEGRGGQSASPTPGPLLLEIGPRGANVRRGPGAEYTVVATRRAGDRMEVLAANVSGEWFEVRVPGQGRGWVSAAYAVALGSVEQLGIRNYELGIQEPGRAATAVSASAQPSATPRPTGSPTPGWTPPGRPSSITATPTAPAPPAPLPTRTPPGSLPKPPTPTLLPPPTARAGG
jgi:tetratricopeptide (TPR) repeat protein